MKIVSNKRGEIRMGTTHPELTPLSSLILILKKDVTLNIKTKDHSHVYFEKDGTFGTRWRREVSGQKLNFL